MDEVAAYVSDPLLDEEVDAALAASDPRMIWAMTATLASMDEEEYQINRLAIKRRFNGRLPMGALDRAVLEKKKEKPSPAEDAQSKKTPPNTIGDRIMATVDLINVDQSVYSYNGTFWQMVSKGFVDQLALRGDGAYKSTKNRRAEITDYIRATTYRRSQAWRQLDMHEIPVKNGVIDIRTARVRPHRKEDYLQSCIPWDFDPDAECPELLKCLSTYFHRDRDGDAKIAAIQEFFGYCLMPHARYKKALFCLGESDSGKSTIPFLIRLLVGQENVSAVGVGEMDDARKRAPLLGKIVNLLTELTSEAMIADGGFKTLVSTEEPILFDPKNEKPIMDIPICKHVIVTNILPRINDKSKGTFNRILLIHFNHVIPLREQDTHIWDRLRLETQGVLAWAIKGARRLVSNGGRFTDPGKAEVEEYRDDQNPLKAFIDDFCVLAGPEDDFRVRVPVFTERFRAHYGPRWSPQQIVNIVRAEGFNVSKHPQRYENVRSRVIFGLRFSTINDPGEDPD